jgi:hypothetical protein
VCSNSPLTHVVECTSKHAMHGPRHCVTTTHIVANTPTATPHIHMLSKRTAYFCATSPSACMAHHSSVRWRQERALRVTTHAHTPTHPADVNLNWPSQRRAWQDTDSTKCVHRKCRAYQEHNNSTKDATTSPPRTRRHRGRPHPRPVCCGVSTTSAKSAEGKTHAGHQKLQTI